MKSNFNLKRILERMSKEDKERLTRLAESIKVSSGLSKMIKMYMLKSLLEKWDQ